MHPFSISRFTILMLFVGILLLSSCAPKLQMPPEASLTAFPDKGDLKIAASVGDRIGGNGNANFQAIYTPVKRLTVGLNYYRVGKHHPSKAVDNYRKSYFMEGAAGTYWSIPLKTRLTGNTERLPSEDVALVFDANAGYGYSEIYSKSENYAGDFDLKTQYYFLQGGAHVKSKKLTIGMMIRAVRLDYIRGAVRGNNFTEDQDFFIANLESEPFTFLETAFRLTAGFKNVKFFTTASIVSSVFGNKSMGYLPLPVQVGVEANLFKLFEKKKGKK